MFAKNWKLWGFALVASLGMAAVTVGSGGHKEGAKDDAKDKAGIRDKEDMAHEEHATPPSGEFQIPEQFKDPSFDRYVDLKAVQEALGSQDAALLTDAALQMAEGERVLMRQHKAFSSKKVIDAAVRLASRKGDSATLARLGKYASASKDKDLATRVEAATKKPTSRKSGVSISLDEVSVGGLEAYREALNRLDAAYIAADRARFASLKEQITEQGGLAKAQREHLTKLIAQDAETAPESADEGDEALALLAGNARGHNRAAVEAGLRQRFSNHIVFSGEYSVAHAALTALDSIFASGTTSAKFWQDEAKKFGVSSAGLLATSRFDPRRDRLYGGRMIFNNWHDFRYRCPTFNNPGRWCDGRTPLPNKFVAWFAVRKG